MTTKYSLLNMATSTRPGSSRRGRGTTSSSNSRIMMLAGVFAPAAAWFLVFLLPTTVLAGQNYYNNNNNAAANQNNANYYNNNVYNQNSTVLAGQNYYNNNNNAAANQNNANYYNNNVYNQNYNATQDTHDDDDGNTDDQQQQQNNNYVGDCEVEGNAVAVCISSDPQNSCLAVCDGNIVPDFAQLSMNGLMDPNVLCPIYQETLCLIVDCCPLCQAEARLLFECQAAQINNEAEFCGDILSVDDCDASPADSGGTDTQDGPTTDTPDDGTTVGGGDDAPPEDCEAEGNAVAFCLSADPQNTCLSTCGTYTPDYAGLAMGDFFNPDVICPIWQDALCLIVDCCPVCHSEAQLLYECQAKQINNEFCGDILSDSKCDGSSANNNVGGGGGGDGDAAASLIESSLLPYLGLILGAAAGLY